MCCTRQIPHPPPTTHPPQLLFELNEDGSPPGSGGSEKWLSIYEATESEVQHDTLAAFRIIDSDKFKLNSEPAPPGTMLESGLLEKLVGTVKKLLAQSGAEASSVTVEDLKRKYAGAVSQLGDFEADLAAMTRERDAAFAKLAAVGGGGAEELRGDWSPLLNANQPQVH